MSQKLYRIYSDGSHYIAYERAYGNKNPSKHKDKDYMDNFFEFIYLNSLKQGLKPKQQQEYIKNCFVGSFGEEEDFTDFIIKNIERKQKNLYSRKKLFKRKAYLNKWNYFVTITYDDKKHTAETFRKKLRKCLSNLHTRHGYCYMGVFEYAPKTGRLHFHALMFIPKGNDIGTYKIIEDYSITDHKMQKANQNSFFLDKFGRNDFREFEPLELKVGNTINYLLKYIGKSNERVCYSRGIAAYLEMELPGSDLACDIAGFVVRYVLYDDVINSDDNIKIKKYRKWQQMHFISNTANT